MIWENFIEALGAMTIAYMLSELSLSLVNKLEQSNRPKILIHFFVLVHLASSLASLFVGLFMHYQKDHANNLQKTVDELTLVQQDVKKRIDVLLSENDQIKDQLRRETARTENRSFEEGRKNGYLNGYAVGFEDCMDVLELPQEEKHKLMQMARMSGIHRIKTRPYIFDTQKAVEHNGILR